MSAVKIVVFSEDQVTSKEIDALLENTLKEALHQSGQSTDVALLWFLDNGVEALVLETPLHRISDGKGPIVVRPHRCRRAEITIEHGGQCHSHSFSPAEKVEHVRNWAIRHFQLDPNRDWYLTLDGTKASELPMHSHIGKFVKPEACSLQVILAHVNAQVTVTIINEDDGAEYKIHGTGETKVETVIAEMYTKLGRKPEKDDRLRCEEGGGDVFAHRNLTLGEYEKAGHCRCMIWLFAGGTGGAAWQS